MRHVSMTSPAAAAEEYSATTKPEGTFTLRRMLRACKHLGMLLVLVLLFLGLQAFLPLGTAVQIGSDEGFELAKATLLLNGHHLYTEVWNDQPPLHTFLITQLLKHVSGSVLLPRLVTVAFAVLLLCSVFAIIRRASGLLAAGLATALVVASPGFLELSASCMLEIPSLATALAALAVLSLQHPASRKLRLVLAGVCFGVALLMKLVPATLLPLAAVIIWLDCPESRNWLKQTLGSLIVLGLASLVTFVLVDLVIERGAFLLHFHQSWTSHFATAKSLEHGSATDHPFVWSILLKHWDATVPAVLGIILLCRKLFGRGSCGPPTTSRKQPITHLTRSSSCSTDPSLLPLAWIFLSFAIFAAHRPWWPYYYVHLAIPLGWCAAIAVEHVIRSARRRKVVVPLFVLGMLAFSWMALRLYFQIADARHLSRIYASPLLTELARFRPAAKWLYTEDPVYSFHSGIPLPPPLGVMVLKRYWCGEMTDQRLADELKSWTPGLILLRNNTDTHVFQDWLDAEYRLAYRDATHRLYVPRTRRK